MKYKLTVYFKNGSKQTIKLSSKADALFYVEQVSILNKVVNYSIVKI